MFLYNLEAHLACKPVWFCVTTQAWLSHPHGHQGICTLTAIFQDSHYFSAFPIAICVL